MLPHTTNQRSTINLKTKNNKNGQKIERYRSPTTKELKKHLSRLVGRAEIGSWGGERHGRAAAGGPGGPTFPYR